MITATKVLSLIDHDTQTQQLYRLSSPVDGIEFFVVSKKIFHSQWETMIFQADESGQVTDWSEQWNVRGEQKIEDTVDAYLKDLNDEDYK